MIQEQASKELQDLKDQLAKLRKNSWEQYSSVRVESEEEIDSLERSFVEREQLLGVSEVRLERQVEELERQAMIHSERYDDDVENAVSENDVLEALLEEECARVGILEEANTVQADELQRTVQRLRREGQNARDQMTTENTGLSLRLKEELLALEVVRDQFAHFESAAKRTEHSLTSQLSSVRAECSSDANLLQDMQEQSGQRHAALISEVMSLRQVLADTEMAKASDASRAQVLEVRLADMNSSNSTTEEMVERANKRHAEAEDKLHTAQKALKDAERGYAAEKTQLLADIVELKERLQSTESSASKELLRLKEQLSMSKDEDHQHQQHSEQHLKTAESELRNVLEEAMLEGQEQKDHLERSERLWQRRVRGIEEELSTARAEMLQQEDLIQDLRNFNSEDRAQGEALAGEIAAVVNGVRTLQQKHNTSIGTLMELKDNLGHERSKVPDQDLQADLVIVPADLAAVDSEILAILDMGREDRPL